MDLDVKQNVNYLLKTTKNERINRKTVVVKSVFSLLIMIKVYHQTSYFMGWNTTIVGCEMSETCLSLNPVVLDISVNADIPWHCAVTVHYSKKKSVRTPFGMKWKGFLPFSHSYSSSFAAVPLSWDDTPLEIFLGAGMKWLFWRYCVDFVVCNFAFIWVEYGRMDGWMDAEWASMSKNLHFDVNRHELEDSCQTVWIFWATSNTKRWRESLSDPPLNRCCHAIVIMYRKIAGCFMRAEV